MSTLAMVAAGTVTGVAGAAAMWIPAKLLRDDARKDRSAADETYDKAEELAAEVDRTRNLPWYWPTDPAVTGEVLAVESAEPLAITAEPHDETDEDGNLGPDERTDGPRWWMLPVLLVAIVVVAALLPVWGLLWLVDWARGKVERRRQRRMDRIAEVAAAEEFADELRALRDVPEVVDVEPATIVHPNHRYLPTGAYSLVKPSGKPAGQHRAKMPINVPAQRDGGDN